MLLQVGETDHDFGDVRPGDTKTGQNAIDVLESARDLRLDGAADEFALHIVGVLARNIDRAVNAISLTGKSVGALLVGEVFL